MRGDLDQTNTEVNTFTDHLMEKKLTMRHTEFETFLYILEYVIYGTVWGFYMFCSTSWATFEAPIWQSCSNGSVTCNPIHCHLQVKYDVITFLSVSKPFCYLRLFLNETESMMNAQRGVKCCLHCLQIYHDNRYPLYNDQLPISTQ